MRPLLRRKKLPAAAAPPPRVQPRRPAGEGVPPASLAEVPAFGEASVEEEGR